MTPERKLKAVETDIKNATTSFVAKVLIKAEAILGNIIHPSFGVREFILCKK